MQVLIADDDPVLRRMLGVALKNWGFEPAEAADGREALAALRRADGPKLAVLDWVMPGLDGPDVCRLVREAATAEPPYLILLTANDAKKDVIAGLQAGANDYVTKPF
ncbi:MAG: response regulator, partial [Gemmataceae bacterium]|nr:response regulator [Gemmataceae bacterium]